jgi:hypothetical protein
LRRAQGDGSIQNPEQLQKVHIIATMRHFSAQHGGGVDDSRCMGEAKDGTLTSSTTLHGRQIAWAPWVKPFLLVFVAAVLTLLGCFVDAVRWLFGAELWLPLPVLNAAMTVIAASTPIIWHLRRKYHGPDAGIDGTLSGAQGMGLVLGIGIVVQLMFIANSG